MRCCSNTSYHSYARKINNIHRKSMANVHFYYLRSLSCVVKNDKKKLDFLSKNCINTTSQLVTYQCYVFYYLF